MRDFRRSVEEGTVMIASVLELTFNGVAYSIVLFLIACGLSITMGLMGFTNLAHGSIVMFGGYLVVALMKSFGWPFLATIPAAFVVCTLVGAAFERLLFRRLYAAGELNQVLLTIGLVFMSVAIATYLWGAGQQPLQMPGYLNARVSLGLFEVSSYRLFLLLVGGAMTVLLVLAFERSNLGAQVRAAVDNRQMAMSCGINVDRLFTLVFAAGCGIAGTGGALSVNLLGLDPSFPLRYLVFILIVVTVGGSGSIWGTLAAALLLGICDVFSKYYVPESGAFTIFAIAALILFWHPQGLFGRAVT
jgi:branched-chain amino acid transport system permease protein